MDELVFVRRGDFEELVDDVVARDAVALGGKIHDDAVPQHRFSQGADVFQRHMRTAMNERAGLGAQYQKLRRPRACSPSQLLAQKSGAPGSRTRVCRTSASV